MSSKPNKTIIVLVIIVGLIYIISRTWPYYIKLFVILCIIFSIISIHGNKSSSKQHKVTPTNEQVPIVIDTKIKECLIRDGKLRKEIGNPLIIITRHNTACELCKPWENKVLIDDLFSGGNYKSGNYPLLSEAVKKGLFHPGCRHGCGTHYPELEKINRKYKKIKF